MMVPIRNLNVVELTAKVVEGSRGHVMRATTLVESTKPEHRVQVYELLQLVNLYTGRAFRVGISGMSEAGRSTFINAMGIKLIEGYNHQVTVLAIDPSSTRTSGSIPNGRTYMDNLAMREEAFIRPSLSVRHLDGVARVTRGSILALEATGYDVMLAETAGVGQSEVVVTGMVDIFLFLHVVRIGDRLRGIKRGIPGLADVISITKADDDNEGEARVSARELGIAMKLISSGESRRCPPVLTCSSRTGADMDEAQEAVTKCHASLEETGGLVSRRRSQQRAWLWSMVGQEVIQSLRISPEVREIAAHVEMDPAAERVNAVEGASDTFETFAHTFRHLSHEPAGKR